MPKEDADRQRKAIHRFLLQEGLTVAGVCTKAGMTSTTMYGYLSGKNNDIGYATLLRFARGAGTTVSILIGEQAMAERPQSPFEAMPDHIARQLGDADIDLIKKIPSLDQSQKELLSAMIDALPKSKKKANTGKPTTKKPK